MNNENNQAVKEYGVASVPSILGLLLDRAEANLSPTEIKWLSLGIDEMVGLELGNLQTTVAGIAGLIGCDENAGNFRDNESVSNLMWSIAHQLDVIRGFSTLANDARAYEHFKPAQTVSE
jgi:hypothetical protein